MKTNYSDLVGEIIGDYQIISYDGRNKHYAPVYTIQCTKCGHIKHITKQSIALYHYKHSLDTCNEDFLKNVVRTDYKFKELLDEYTDRNEQYCNIQCTKCGHIKKVLKSNFMKYNYFHNGLNCEEDYYKEKVGETIEDMVLIKFLGYKNNMPRFLAKCKICGYTKEIYYSNFCKRHGTKHDEYSHLIYNEIEDRTDPSYRAFYKRWRGMMQRCYNPSNNRYYLYGARGIKVCDRWHDFHNYFLDNWNSFKEFANEHGLINTTMDRIDVNKDYSPENCTWATQEEQSNNRRYNLEFEVYDEATKEFIGKYRGLNKYLRANNYVERDRGNIKNRLNGRVASDVYRGRIYKKVVS